MDKIYSRRRIKLPKIEYKNFNNKKNIKTPKFLIIVVVVLITFIIIMNSIGPIFETLCEDKAKSIATIICNEESTKIVKEYQYNDLSTIYRDKDDNITMIKSNVTTINLIISDIAEKIQKRINETQQEDIGITLGSFIGSRILSGFGPMIPIKLSVIGNVDTDLRSEFKSAGINQTIHRIYLQVDCKINILTSYKSIKSKISNQILLAENIIVGKIPEAYYNLEGMTKENTTDIIK